MSYSFDLFIDISKKSELYLKHTEYKNLVTHNKQIFNQNIELNRSKVITYLVCHVLAVIYSSFLDYLYNLHIMELNQDQHRRASD